MEQKLELKILALALSRGLLSAEDLESVERSAGSEEQTLPPGRWGWRISLLIGKGVLRAEQVEELEQEILAEPASRPPTTPIPTQPTTPSTFVGGGRGSFRSEAPVPEVTRKWGRYRVADLLGEGGMGKVFRAFDPRLERWVALKFLHTDDPEMVRRFLQEARVQASVQHDNICPIYEVGEVEGRPYIAMQLIKGTSLSRLAPGLTLREKVRLARDVALALHAAHEHGLVHRDVKPGNILVERLPSGEYKPYVVDFGLAREVAAPRVTLSGAVLGTVAFMAPEQGSPEDGVVDRRADVYALGATLYDTLAGRPPYLGNSLEVIVQKAERDPPPLARIAEDVPRDLEAVVMKCLQRDPGDRYATARELAEDLDRWLTGEPVHARPVTWATRGISWVRRNRVASAALAALLLTVLASATWVGWTSWQAGRQAVFARRFTQETIRLENGLRMILARPLHPIGPEIERLRKHLEALEETVRDVGGAARGPGEYALGRGYLALGDFEAADRHLARAWDLGYREPEVSFTWGMVLANLYRQQLESIQRISDRRSREELLQEAEARYRDPAMRLLRQGRAVDVEAPEFGEALLAFLEQDLDTAIAKCREAIDRIPWLHAARALEGDIEITRFSTAREEGDVRGAEAALDRAQAAYSEVVRIAPSDPKGYEGLCNTLNFRAMLLVDSGSDPVAVFGEARERCRQALQADEAFVPAYAGLAFVCLQWGEYRMLHGSDPSDILDEAVRASECGLRLRPDDPGLNTYAGLAQLQLARTDMALGRDPRRRFREASRRLERALHLDPNHAQALNSLGLVWLERAFWEHGMGLDPTEALDHSIASFERYIALRPGAFVALDNLGAAYWARAHALVDRGRDPEEAVRKAEAVLGQALSVYPEDWVAHNNRGLARIERARYLALQGHDPEPVLRAAFEDFEAALRINGRDASTRTNMANAHAILADYRARKGQDPRPGARAALEAARRAAELNPMDAEAWLILARARLTLARWTLTRGGDPSTDLQRAEEAVDRALALNPASVDAMVEQARAARISAQWALRAGRNPGPEIDEGLQWAREALSRSGEAPRAHAERARLLALKARLVASPDERRTTGATARQELEEALRLNPLLAGELRPLAGQLPPADPDPSR